MKVAVTRPEGQGEELARQINELGHEAVVCPLVALEPLGDEPVMVDRYDWVIVTSVNGATELKRRMIGEPARLAAIGAATAAAFGRADLVPVVSTQEGLLAELPRPAGRVLFAGAEHARRLLIDELDADFVPLYRTLELDPERFPDCDLVVLASPSAARAYARTEATAPAVSIGPETSRAALAAGVEVAAQAETHDLEGLVRAVARVAR